MKMGIIIKLDIFRIRKLFINKITLIIYTILYKKKIQNLDTTNNVC